MTPTVKLNQYEMRLAYNARRKEQKRVEKLAREIQARKHNSELNKHDGDSFNRGGEYFGE